MSSGLVYQLGERFLAFSIAACVLLVIGLLLNERTGFYRSRRARRPSDARDKFTMLEVAVLFALLLLNVFVTVQVSTDKPYVGEQVIYTWRLYRRVNISDARLEPQTFDGFHRHFNREPT